MWLIKLKMSKTIPDLIRQEIEWPTRNFEKFDMDEQTKRAALSLCYSRETINNIFGIHFLYGQIEF
jgi:hypothetical protein